MVLVLIGGTYTPFCLLVLGNAWGITMLSVVWGIAGVGIILNTAWPEHQVGCGSASMLPSAGWRW